MMRWLYIDKGEQMNLLGIFLTYLLKCILQEKKTKTGTLTLLTLQCFPGNTCIWKNMVWKFLMCTILFYLKRKRKCHSCEVGGAENGLPLNKGEDDSNNGFLQRLGAHKSAFTSVSSGHHCHP